MMMSNNIRRIIGAALTFLSGGIALQPTLVQANHAPTMSWVGTPIAGNPGSGWFDSFYIKFDVDCHDDNGITTRYWGLPPHTNEFPNGTHVAWWGWRTIGSGADFSAELWTRLVKHGNGEIVSEERTTVCGEALPDPTAPVSMPEGVQFSLEKSASLDITLPTTGTVVNNPSGIFLSGTYEATSSRTIYLWVYNESGQRERGAAGVVNSDGTWTAGPTVLTEGSNRLTATLTTHAGHTVLKEIFMTYTPPGSNATPTPTPSNNDGGGGDSGGGGGGGGGGDEQPQPKKGQVKGVISQVCSRSKDTKAKDFIQNAAVPSVVDRLFDRVFAKKTTPIESNYWKGRARCDKATESKLKGAMLWHKARGSSGVKPQQIAGTHSSNRSDSLVPRINALFRSVYSRNPSVSENQYWASRIKDKPTEAALRGTILFHKNSGITH